MLPSNNLEHEDSLNIIIEAHVFIWFFLLYKIEQFNEAFNV